MASQEWYRSWRNAGYSTLIFCQHCVAELPSAAQNGGAFDGPKPLHTVPRETAGSGLHEDTRIAFGAGTVPGGGEHQLRTTSDCLAVP